MLKKRWLNVVRMLSVCHPYLSRDVWRCQRWPGWRLFHVALHGGVLIESGHSPSSGGYACDAVLLDQTMAEHDTCYSCNRSVGGSWTSYNLSPWVVGPQLTCCWGQEEWSGQRVGQREVGWQNALGLWWRWQGSWALLSEGRWH